MARIARSAPPADFQALRSEAAMVGEHNDCSVKAVALVTGRTYAEAHAALKALGRKDRHGANLHLINRAVEQFGFRLKLIRPSDKISQYPGAHKNLKHVTTHHPARFNAVWRDGRTYLFYTARHVLAVINGVNHDWTVNNAMAAPWIYEVQPCEG